MRQQYQLTSAWPEKFAPSSALVVWLDYVRSLRSFLTLNNFELYRVAFLQAFVAFGINGAVMNENVRSVVSSNEPVSFSVVKPLHSTFQTIHVRPLECVMTTHTPNLQSLCVWSDALSSGREFILGRENTYFCLRRRDFCLLWRELVWQASHRMPVIVLASWISDRITIVTAFASGTSAISMISSASGRA